jgi:hypothetical protein
MATTAAQLEKTAPGAMGAPDWRERLSAGWMRTQVRWATMLPAQRSWTVAAAVMILALLAGLLWYGLRTDWRMLYGNLDAEDGLWRASGAEAGSSARNQRTGDCGGNGTGRG